VLVLLNPTLKPPALGVAIEGSPPPNKLIIHEGAFLQMEPLFIYCCIEAPSVDKAFWPLINLLTNLFYFTRASDKFVEYLEAEFLNVFIHWPFLRRLNDHRDMSVIYRSMSFYYKVF